MKLTFLLVLLSVLAVAFANADYPEPPQTFTASKYTTWDSENVANSRRSVIDIQFKDANGKDDFVKMERLDLVGTAKERGFAHGALIAKEIVDFTGPQLDKYIRDMIDEIDISGLPEPVQKILKPIEKLGKVFAPKLAHEALKYVWNKEDKYIPQELKDEISGIASGMCSVLGDKCDVAEWTQKLKEVNMLPELIRMSCTAFGSWGSSRDADSGGKLLQLRALDFGGGPFASNTVIQVHRGDPENPDNAFVSVSFPGFVGVITGVSQSGIGISEKVWMVSDEKKSMQKGHYDGIPDTFTLRHTLEFSKTKEEAIEFMQNAKRTWGMWVGVGDYSSQEFNLVGYREEDCNAYDDKTMPSMNGQPYIPQVAYVDKHPQPSNPNGTLPIALQDFSGNISPFTTKQIIQFHETGDLHAAAYDFGNKQMHLTIGRTNKEGNYCPDDCPDKTVWMAYNRPWTQFDLEDLWNGN
eukprot:GSChrysophyteH1.ASY1.ANO1.2692.1 assembled CDS